MKLIRCLCGLLCGSVLIFGLIAPLTTLLLEAFSGEGFFLREFLDPVLGHIAWMTVKQAFLSMFFSALIGLPLGLWVGSRPGFNRGWMHWVRAALAAPYTFPTIVVAMSGILWLGRNGILSQLGIHLDWAYRLEGVILMHVWLNAPWVALAVAQRRAVIPHDQIECARTLGARFRKRWADLYWPQIRLPLLACLIQVFSLCAMSFTIVLLLGGGPPVQTLETALYSKIRYVSLDLKGALACAVLQLLITMIPWFLMFRIQRKYLKVSRANPPVSKRDQSPVDFLIFLLVFLFILPYLLPLFSVSWSLLLEEGMIGTLLQALGVTLKIAISVTLFCTLCVFSWIMTDSWLRARPIRRWKLLFRETLLLGASLPAGVSIMVLCLGFWMTYQKWLDPFSGSLMAVILIQGMIFLPFAFWIVWPYSIISRKNLFEMARTLGAHRFQAFLATVWPLWRGPFLKMMTMVFAASLGDVAVVSFYQSENLRPLPLLMADWMRHYRFDEAQLISGLLLLLPLVTVLVFSFLERPQKA